MSKLIAGCVLALSFSVTAFAPAAFAAEKTETIHVNGWHCGGCAARTESALKDVKGVSTVAADKTKNQVTITYDDKQASHADLEKAITDAGYQIAKN